MLCKIPGKSSKLNDDWDRIPVSQSLWLLPEPRWLLLNISKLELS